MKRIVVLAAVLVMLAAAVGFSQAQKPVTLRLGLIEATGHPVHLGSKYMAELVEKGTSGRVKIEVYPDATLGAAFEMQNSVKLGTLDMTNAGCGVTAGSLPEYNITTFYYVWKSLEHMRAFFNSDLCKGFNQKYLDTTGIRILASNWEQGDRQTLSKRPIRKVDDLKGLKIRVPQLESYVAAWKAMGANPTPMAITEVYSALQQGVVDAIEIPLDWIYANKYYEQAKYVILTAHLGYPNQVYISEKSFQKLSPEDQKVLAEAAVKAGEYATKLQQEGTAGLRAKLEAAGVTFIDVNRAEFAAKVGMIVPDFEKLWGAGLWAKVQALK
jgi:TRAP-type transport system periplasmic protein